VQEFLDALKASDPDDFAVVLAGLTKLRHRQYHLEPLTKALGDGLFELRHVGKLNMRVLWFFMKGHRIVAVHGIRTNGLFRLGGSLPTLATILKAAGYRTGAFVGAFVLDARFGLNRGRTLARRQGSLEAPLATS